MDDLWETHAQWWQDGFTNGADPEYVEQIEPLVTALLRGFGSILDLGCGEGQLARALVDKNGSRVVGIDPTHAQIDVADNRGGGVTYLVGDAALVPLGDESFDAVLACLVFEHIDTLHEAIEEISRVLRPHGRFVLALNHPFIQVPDSGWIDDWTLDPPEHYWRVGAYLAETHTIEEVTKGVHIPFVHRPLSQYVNALADAGLHIEHMVEPPPPPGFLARSASYEAAAMIPRLLVLVTTKYEQ